LRRHNPTARGFTGHEHIDLFELVNMDGRVYDPRLGRFLSPDPYVQDPTYSQSLNRYSYVWNNPLRYTDENGYWFGWDDLVDAIVGAVVGYVSYGLSTGNWGWKALAAAGIGAGIAWLGWNTMGAGTAALAKGAGTATSFTAGVSAVFSSASGYYGIQFAVVSGLNTLAHKDQLAAADKKEWNGVWTLGAYMAASVLSTSLKPLSIGAKEGGLGLRQFVGVVLTNNISDNFKDGEFDFHSIHVGPIGYDWKYRNDDKWGGFYTIFSKGLSADQRFDMGLEMFLGLSLIQSDIYLPKYHRYQCGKGVWKISKNLHDLNQWRNKVIAISKVGTFARRILQASDIYFLFRHQKTTLQYWYDENFNSDGTFIHN